MVALSILLYSGGAVALSAVSSAPKNDALPLVTFGGWISISNLLDPLFFTSDRLILGAVVSMNAVTYYAYAVRHGESFRSIPDALNILRFPGVRLKHEARRTTRDRIVGKGRPLSVSTDLRSSASGMLFARQILSMWIYPAFAAHSALVLEWLAASAVQQSRAGPLQTLLVAHRPDLPANLERAKPQLTSLCSTA